MTNSEDCPLKSNSELRAEFVDGVQVERRAKLAQTLDRAGEWLSKLPESEAHNASRLHVHNLAERREGCDLIDQHRATPEGKAVYNAKRRDSYVPVGDQKREYVTGLSEEEKAERRRLKKRASDKKRSAKTPTAVKSAKRAKSRKNKADREATEEAAMIDARRIV